MKRKFKVVFTILLVLTAIIPVLAYKQNIDYPRYVQELKREYEDLGINPDIITPSPWCVWGMGGLVTVLVVVIIDAWIVSSIIWFQERRRENRKEVK